MPGTNEEYIRLATAPNLVNGFHVGQTWLDGTAITDRDAADVEALWYYHQRQLGHKKRRIPQAKALRLLRRYLSPDQLIGLQHRGEFYLSLPNGNTYRLNARRGSTEKVTRHGRRWFVRRRFCLHETSLLVQPMPPADLVLTHMLLLLADEREFLDTANATDANGTLWNGQWLRRLREARRAREAATLKPSEAPTATNPGDETI